MYTWYAITVQENGLYYSYAAKIANSYNLVSFFASIKGLCSANACETKKEASFLAEFWNDTYKANKTYMFQDGPHF